MTEIAAHSRLLCNYFCLSRLGLDVQFNHDCIFISILLPFIHHNSSTLNLWMHSHLLHVNERLRKNSFSSTKGNIISENLILYCWIPRSPILPNFSFNTSSIKTKDEIRGNSKKSLNQSLKHSFRVVTGLLLKCSFNIYLNYFLQSLSPSFPPSNKIFIN